jgi:WD40 repeat protein
LWQVWSSASLALLMRLPVFHSARISALAFSWGEGNILASTGAEGAAGGVRRAF